MNAETKTNWSEYILPLKLRRGPSHGIDKRGAYWTPEKGKYFADLGRSGGDGIGASRPTVSRYLDVRHYRDGTVYAGVVWEIWHENTGEQRRKVEVEIYSCTTVEQVIALLRGVRNDGLSAILDHTSLADALSAIGLPLAEPSPDELA